MSLLDDHIADLQRSGLSDDTIALMNVRSLDAADLRATLGYAPDGVRSALALPYPRLDFERYKLFPLGRDKDGHSIRYLQGKGTGVHFYILESTHAVLADASVPLYWTEGEKKAAKATQEGFRCVGLGGLWNWPQAGTADGITELDAIVHVDREEIIVPDSDVWTRPDLLQAVYALGKELEAHGAHVRVAVIPAGPNGAKLGLDDFLGVHGANAFRALQPIDLKHKAFTKQAEWYKEWKRKRQGASETSADDKPGGALDMAHPEPWPEPVNGARLLDALTAVFRRYVVLPEGAADALALWVLHTYCLDVIDTSPILAVLSPEKRCGKTTLLALLRAVVSRPLPTSNVSPAVLFRVAEKFTPTLLIDEADSFARENEQLRGILNSGHTRTTAYILRCVGDDFEPRRFTTFCPKAIAAIGTLPGTIIDRAIVLQMRRKTISEAVGPFRFDRVIADLLPLRRQAVRWASDCRDSLRNRDASIPSELHDRAADNWRPLIVIADLSGDAWSERTRRAALLLSGEQEDTDVKVQLLEDLRELFDVRGVDRLASEALVAGLSEMKERPWPEYNRGKPITARQVARLLNQFGVRSKQLKVEAKNVHGYRRGDCEDAFSRYVPSPLGSDPLPALPPAPGLAKVDVSRPLPDGNGSGSKDASPSDARPVALGADGSGSGASTGEPQHRDSCDDGTCLGCMQLEAEVIEQ